MGRGLAKESFALNSDSDSDLGSSFNFETPYRRDFSKLTRFTTILPEDTKNFALKAPVAIKESRFLLAKDSLAEFFAQLEPTFSILKIDNNHRTFSQTHTHLYFDTPQFDLYKSQDNKRSNRYQVCIKQSRNTNERFLEVQCTSRNSKTRNLTMLLAELENRQETQEEAQQENQRIKVDFLNKHLPRRYARLEASLMSKFERITFLSKKAKASQKITTKLTIDFDVEFYKPYEHNKECLPEFVSITLSEDFREGTQGGSSLNEFQDAYGQEAYGLKPVLGSQYSTGCSLLYPELKQNRFKSLLTALVG